MHAGDIDLKMLMDRNLPCTVLRFLYSWYQDQELAVRWNSNFSETFGVTQMVYARAMFSLQFFFWFTLTSYSSDCHDLVWVVILDVTLLVRWATPMT